MPKDTRSLALALAVAVLATSGATRASAQPLTRRVATVTAIKNFTGFYHGQNVLVRGELRDPETRPTLVSGDQFVRLIGKEALPGTGAYDVRGQVLDIGRTQADDPRLSGVDLALLGIDPSDRWPRQGEVVVLKVAAIEKAEPLPAPSIRALALDPDRYVDQRVTVKGQFRARNLFGDVPQAPLEAAKPKGEFVLRSADAAIWVLGKQPKGRGFQLDPSSRIDTQRWLEVSGIVREARGLVWIDAQELTETAPVKEVVAAETADAPPAPISPEVLFSAPTEGETDVAIDTSVRVQFSRDIDPPSFRGNVQVTYVGVESQERGEPQAPAISAQLRYDPGHRVLSITFSAPLERFRTVTVELLDGIRGTDGAPLKPWKLTFAVGG